LRACGARRGYVLVLVAGQRPEFPIVVCGALAAGLTLAPASPLLTARELRAFMAQTGARYVVAEASALSRASEAASAAGVDTVFALDSLPAGEPDTPEVVDPQSLAVLEPQTTKAATCVCASSSVSPPWWPRKRISKR
jgi:long-chain acyl-CoA synthetase